MRIAPALAALIASLGAVAAAAAGTGTGLGAGSGPGAAQTMPGVSNPARTRIDYILKCQGCHQPGGGGNTTDTPPLAGEVARFLSVKGGREFLVRVPGVASVDLSDERLAELLNWTLYRFDAGHLPADFRPYTAAEIARLRRSPLRLERAEVREKLVSQVRRGT
jgi:hypothetical protein